MDEQIIAAAKGTLGKSRKAQASAAGVAVIVGMVTQGLDITIAAYLVAGLTALNVIAWMVQNIASRKGNNHA